MSVEPEGRDAPPPERWRKKPVVIDAVQITQALAKRITDADEKPPFGTQFLRSDRAANGHFTRFELGVETLEGWMRGGLDDWVIRGVKGESYFCKPDIFAATYEPAGGSSQAGSAPAFTDEDFKAMAGAAILRDTDESGTPPLPWQRLKKVYERLRGAGSAGSPAQEVRVRALEIAQRVDDELVSATPATNARDMALTELLEGVSDTLRTLAGDPYDQRGAASPSSPGRINGEVEALRDVVRAVDVELYGKDTAANVHSDEYAAKLFKRGVRASGEGREPAVPTDGD